MLKHRIALILLTQIACFKYYISAAETKGKISEIFEGFGYSPSCVAKSLASCEPLATPSHEKAVADSLATIIDILNESKHGKKRPKNCAEIQAMGNCVSGIRTIYPYECPFKAVEVFCDQTPDGGGWTVFQNRDNHTERENFFRPWNDYVSGFGNLTGEFWLGLDHIHAIVRWTKMEMRVDIEDFEGAKRLAKYNLFSIGDDLGKYALFVGGYSGDAGDAFGIGGHSGQSFTTRDQDNDKDVGNCAQVYKGGWWYNACHNLNLNGLPHVGHHESYADGINWRQWRGLHYSLRKANMKIRPIFSEFIKLI